MILPVGKRGESGSEMGEKGKDVEGDLGGGIKDCMHSKHR